MKKVTIFTSTFLILIGFGCSSTQKTAQRVQVYSTFKFEPEQIKQVISPDFEIQIIPIDAAETNKESFEAANRDGVYDNEIIRSWIGNTIKATSESDLNPVTIFNEIDQLIGFKFLPMGVGREFKMQIAQKGNFGNGSEVESLSDNLDESPDIYNPYKVNERYLSVFKVIFFNESDSIITLKSSDIQIISGNELLSPLSSGYFEKMLEGNSEKLKNVYRMNLPENLALVPHEQVVKFIAVPAINTTKGKVSIKMIAPEKKITTFDFSISQQSGEKKYTFYQFSYKTDKEIKSEYRYVVVKQGGRIYSLMGNTLFALSSSNPQSFGIYYAAFTKKQHYFGKIANVSPNQQDQSLLIPIQSLQEIQRKMGPSKQSPDLLKGTKTTYTIPDKNEEEIFIDKVKVAAALNCPQTQYSSYEDVKIGDAIKYETSLDVIYGIVSGKTDNNKILINTYPKQGALKILEVSLKRLYKVDYEWETSK